MACISNHVKQSATGKSMTYQWNDELRYAVQQVRILPVKLVQSGMFHTRTGKPYINDEGKANAFDSLWQRFMKRVPVETDVNERFSEHDLRAKVASDTKPEHARQSLGHSSVEITDRVYRRKPALVIPHTRGK